MNQIEKQWEIGLSAWIIQDGNYGDFEKDQIAEFALEFYSENRQKSSSFSKSCKPLGANKYSIVGEVVYLNDSPNVWVLDFGICAFAESKPPKEIQVGDFIAAEIHLDIDPFPYFERLHALPKIPPLIYSWRIDSISQQTAPFIETEYSDMVRDGEKLDYKPISKTNAWDDDNGHAEYVLTCNLLSVPPKFKSATAIQP